MPYFVLVIMYCDVIIACYHLLSLRFPTPLPFVPGLIAVALSLGPKVMFSPSSMLAHATTDETRPRGNRFHTISCQK